MERIKNNSINGLIIFLFVLTGCAKTSLPVDEYVTYVSNPENGLVAEKIIQEYKITLSYLPVEYMALKEIKTVKRNSAQYDSVFSKYKDHEYFKLRIENMSGSNSPVRKDVATYPEYAQKLDYLSFYGQNDIKMVANSDTLECVLYHFENNYGLLPFNDIQMAFKKSQNLNSDLEIIWNDVVIGVGRVKFTIDKDNLKNIPEPIL